MPKAQKFWTVNCSFLCLGLTMLKFDGAWATVHEYDWTERSDVIVIN